jgi:hypothetical protein
VADQVDVAGAARVAGGPHAVIARRRGAAAREEREDDEHLGDTACAAQLNGG